MNVVSPLGLDLDGNWKALLRGESGIHQQDVGSIKDVYVAKITNLITQQGFSFLESMLYSVLKPVLEGKTIHARTGFILSSTKGNIDLLAQGNTKEVELSVLADKLTTYFGFTTKPIVVSHACVSGVLAVSVAKRLIQVGQFDDVVVVAGDCISEFVLSGFQSFQAMSSEPCKPFDAQRNGVSLGEASAAVFVTKSDDSAVAEIVGEASINDANHISGPSRTGEGLFKSIKSALKEAQIGAKDVDFISAHGTATLYNDEMEAVAFDRLGMNNIDLHSLKGYYGHTLGAAGLLELVVAIKSMCESTIIPSKGFDVLGTSKHIQVAYQLENKAIRYLLKTASGFGGSNTAMLVKKYEG